MNYLVFDIETRNTFDQVGSASPSDLDLSVLSIYNSKTDSVTSYEMDDLDKAWEHFNKIDFIVGFNSDHFDIPLLQKYYPGDLYAIKSIDLMKSVKESLGRRIKLDSIAEATLGKKKLADGLEAIRWWNEGKIDLIKKYCEEDVLITKDIFLFALKNKLVKAVSRDGLVIDIPIDTSDWTLDSLKQSPQNQSLF